jgi:thiol:disulfide interchange protein DsbD
MTRPHPGPWLCAVLTLLALLWPAAATLCAAPPGNKQVDATLLADTTAVQPGKPFTAGVLLKIKPGWHVYWKNPGDSGLPTKVEWKRPEGWKAGELRYPIPTRIELPGNEAIIGYEKEVLLTAEITPPNNLAEGSKASLAADVSYLVCEQICLPGKIELSLDVPVAAANSQPAPANAGVFDQWKPRLPEQSLQKVEAVTTDSGGRYSFTFHLPDPAASDVQWLAVPPENAGMKDAKATTSGAAASYSFSLVPPPTQPAPMQFLITFNDANGKRGAVEFTVNLPAAK